MPAKPYRALYMRYEASCDETLFGEIAALPPPADDEETAFLLVMIGKSLRAHGMPHDRSRQTVLAGAVDQVRKAVQRPGGMN